MEDFPLSFSDCASDFGTIVSDEEEGDFIFGELISDRCPDQTVQTGTTHAAISDSDGYLVGDYNRD
jgi:hypothetical protein